MPTSREFLRQLRRRAPRLASRVRLHPTGSGPADLSRTGLVLFWLADPLLERYPDCYAEAVVIEAEARERWITTLNPPGALNNTSKSTQAEIWRAAGIACQPVIRVADPGALSVALDQVDLPCILRSDISHAQHSTHVVRSPSEVLATARQVRGPIALIPLLDLPRAYRERGETGLYARFHHKARAIIAGNQVIASHLFFAKSPIVSQASSLFARESRPRRVAARRVGFRASLLKALIQADLDYFERPVAHAETLRRAVRVLGLDFAAIDYSFAPDGSVILWEANPFFYLPHGRHSVMSGPRQAERRVDATYARLVSALSEAVAINDARRTRPAA